jgi:hypothetical protein
MKRRQGDVIIEKCETIPGGVKKLAHLTLAEGEVTGHAHRVVEGEAELFEKDGVMFLSVSSDTAVVTHEEHKAQTLERGTYKVTIQREYTPEGWRRVAD